MIWQQRDLVRVVEAAYQVEVDEQQWLAELADVFSTMRGGELGLVVYSYDASKPADGVHIPRYAAKNVDDSFVRAHLALNANTPAQEVLAVYHRGVLCGTASEVLAAQNLRPEEQPVYVEMIEQGQVRDTWGLSASNPGGRGVGVACPLNEVSAMREEARELWCLVGVHLATAYRLRRLRRGDDVSHGAAVFDPGGNLVHAEGADVDQYACKKLRQAVRLVDRARSKSLRQNPVEALPLWRGMVEGRWTLVDRVDSDGRRLVVAHPNELRFEEPAKLTERERQVVAFASQGDSTARISYSLGLDEETVEALITSAVEKLGVRSVDDLIHLRQSLSP